MERGGSAADPGAAYRVERPVYSDAVLQSQLLTRKDNGRSLRERVARHCRCSRSRARAAVLSFLPFLSWLPSYPVKQFLFSDVVSGLSTGVVQLPQGLAYALLAAVPPVYGLYSSFYPVLLYTFFGTSRHISVGTFAVISLMIGGVAIREAPDAMFVSTLGNGTNVTTVVDAAQRDLRRVQVAVALTTLAGLIQILLGLLRFGFVSIYLTEPLVRGFTTAASVHVCASQLKYLLGVETQRFSGPFSALRSVQAVLISISSTNVPALVLGVACMLFLLAVKEVNQRFKERLLLPIPGEIIVVMAATGASYGLALARDHGVDVVGDIPTGLLPPSVPEFSLFPHLLTDAFAVAIVGFSMGISLAKIFALKHGYSVDGNQELIALGLCNFIGSFFSTFAITCSMSRSLIQESTGGKTQIAGLLSSLLVLLVVLAIGFLFEPLPQTALAAIVMVNLVGMFKQFLDIRTLWRTSKIELSIWLVAFVASVLLGLDYGLLVAIVFAILTVIFRTQSPKSGVLGHVPGTGLYYDVDEYEEAVEFEGIKIFYSNSPVYFANSDLYVNSLKEKTGLDPERLQSAGRRRQKQETVEKEEQENQEQQEEQGSPLKICVKSEEQEVAQEAAVRNHVAAENPAGEGVRLRSGAGVHSLVLDWTPVTFVDSVGAKAVKQVMKEYAAVDVQVVVVTNSGALLDQLEKLRFFGAGVSRDVIFPTVHDAALHCVHARGRGSFRGAEQEV